jgi:hypothetical protein
MLGMGVVFDFDTAQDGVLKSLVSSPGLEMSLRLRSEAIPNVDISYTTQVMNASPCHDGVFGGV